MQLSSRFELLETNYLNKEEEFRQALTAFVFDQIQLAKTFRRDVDELKRTQQEHMSKLDGHSMASSFDDLIQQQVNKYYHYRNVEDDEEDECGEDDEKRMKRFEKSHDEHVLWFKKKKRIIKSAAPIVERLRE